MERYGLPKNSSLSILCVEVFGYIRNIVEHISDLRFKQFQEETVKSIVRNLDQDVEEGLDVILKNIVDKYQIPEDSSRPMSSDLGKYRILRTSPLTKVPDTCCVDC